MESEDLIDIGCGVLFKTKEGNILICGEKRLDNNQFLCKRCLKEHPQS